MPTITVQGMNFEIIDEGDTWVIHQPRAILDHITASIVDTYRIEARIAAEENRTLPAGLTRLTVDMLSRKLHALAVEGGITILTDDMLVAPHVGEWAGTTAQQVADELDRALSKVRDWVRDTLDAHAEYASAGSLDELGLRVADGRVARAQLREMALAAKAAGETVNESDFARRGSIDRQLVRRWLGKR